MNVRLKILTSGKVLAERELTQHNGQPTGVWMPISEYKSIRGAKIGVTFFARKHAEFVYYQPTIHQLSVRERLRNT